MEKSKKNFFFLLVASTALIGAIFAVQTTTNLTPKAGGQNKTFTFNFVEGYNAFSMPLKTGLKAYDMCVQLPGAIDVILKFHEDTQTFSTFDCGDSGLGFDLESYEGYFVYMNQPRSWIVSGTQTSPTYDLQTGLNLLGFKSRGDNFTADDVCRIYNNQQGLESYSLRKYVDGQFETYFCNPALEPDFEIEEGVGYFLTMHDRQTPNPPNQPNLPIIPPGQQN